MAGGLENKSSVDHSGNTVVKTLTLSLDARESNHTTKKKEYLKLHTRFDVWPVPPCAVIARALFFFNQRTNLCRLHPMQFKLQKGRTLLGLFFVAFALFLLFGADLIPQPKSPDFDRPIFISTLIALASATLIIIPRTRTLGSFLAGAWLSFIIFVGYIALAMYPHGFPCRGQTIDFSIIFLVEILIVGLGIFAGAVFLRDDKRLMEIFHQKEAALRNQEEQHGRLAEDVKALNARLVQECGRHRETLNNRPYESQLAMSFAVSLCSEWLKKYPGKDFVLNSFQGNLDRTLADVFGATNACCWLVELKRTRKEISSEWEKPARKRQCDALQANSEINRIADRCHWLGWGDKGQEADPVLRFFRYWQSQDLKAHPELVIDIDRFTKRAFLPQGGIGVSFQEIKAYLKFLFSATVNDSIAVPDSDSFAVLVFSWSPEQGVRAR